MPPNKTILLSLELLPDGPREQGGIESDIDDRRNDNPVYGRMDSLFDFRTHGTIRSRN